MCQAVVYLQWRTASFSGLLYWGWEMVGGVSASWSGGGGSVAIFLFLKNRIYSGMYSALTFAIAFVTIVYSSIQKYCNYPRQSQSVKNLRCI